MRQAKYTEKIDTKVTSGIKDRLMKLAFEEYGDNKSMAIRKTIEMGLKVIEQNRGVLENASRLIEGLTKRGERKS